jgi:hypothetical protein
MTEENGTEHPRLWSNDKCNAHIRRRRERERDKINI